MNWSSESLIFLSTGGVAFRAEQRFTLQRLSCGTPLCIPVAYPFRICKALQAGKHTWQSPSSSLIARIYVLKDLRLYVCISDGRSLVDCARARKRSGSATIRRLRGTLFTTLSSKAEGALKAEVSYCTLKALHTGDGDYYQNDDFDPEFSQTQVQQLV